LSGDDVIRREHRDLMSLLRQNDARHRRRKIMTQ
jgi:hypothetical protein